MDYPVSISVIMPNYNTDIPTLQEAVESILNQTFRDFEFLIIDDGSTNESVGYLKNIRDERVRVIWNPENVGVTKALNVGLREAKGKYIARMDSDDISLPQRFEKQFAYMEKHPETVLCGSRVELFGTKNGLGMKPIRDTETYRARILFGYPGPMHPTIFVRHETLLDNNLQYTETLKYSQDYRLYSQIVNFGKIYIFKKPLLRYRIHKKQISTVGLSIQMQCSKSTQRIVLEKLLGPITDEELDRHYIHSSGYDLGGTINDEIVAWYDRIGEANKTAKIYDQKKLEKMILFMKRRLVKLTFTKEMSFPQKARMAARYLPFDSCVRALLNDALKNMWK